MFKVPVVSRPLFKAFLLCLVSVLRLYWLWIFDADRSRFSQHCNDAIYTHPNIPSFSFSRKWIKIEIIKRCLPGALAWKTRNGGANLWKSNLPHDIEIPFFIATVQSVLLYGCKCWTLKSTLQRSLDGCYTGTPTRVSTLPTNILYGELPKRQLGGRNWPVTAADTTSFPPANYWYFGSHRTDTVRGYERTGELGWNLHGRSGWQETLLEGPSEDDPVVAKKEQLLFHLEASLDLIKMLVFFLLFFLFSFDV